METKKNNNEILVGILIGIIIMLLVLVGLFATGTISFKTTTINENGQASENKYEDTSDTSNDTIEEETTKKVDDEQLGNNNCKYLQADIEKLVLNYYIKLNGSKADNGEAYQVESLLENNKYNVRIKHLQGDHITTDEYYVVDCNTGIGTSTSDTEKTINFLEYK
ncbi:MAG: hypothetical protein IKF19_02750 [Bacilli bacterium]|nr:hypothetical protein [Bacilli bacterium]